MRCSEMECGREQSSGKCEGLSLDLPSKNLSMMSLQAGIVDPCISTVLHCTNLDTAYYNTP